LVTKQIKEEISMFIRWAQCCY